MNALPGSKVRFEFMYVCMYVFVWLLLAALGIDGLKIAMHATRLVSFIMSFLMSMMALGHAWDIYVWRIY